MALLLSVNVQHDGQEFVKNTPYDKSLHEEFKHLFTEGGAVQKVTGGITNATPEVVNEAQSKTVVDEGAGAQEVEKPKTKKELLNEIQEALKAQGKETMTDAEYNKANRLSLEEIKELHAQAVVTVEPVQNEENNEGQNNA